MICLSHYNTITYEIQSGGELVGQLLHWGYGFATKAMLCSIGLLPVPVHIGGITMSFYEKAYGLAKQRRR
jgi:hypothetical protein